MSQVGVQFKLLQLSGLFLFFEHFWFIGTAAIEALLSDTHTHTPQPGNLKFGHVSRFQPLKGNRKDFIALWEKEFRFDKNFFQKLYIN